MYVIDTNMLIYFFKGHGQVAQKLLSQSPKEIGIPAIVLYELQVGIARSRSPRKRLSQLEEVTSITSILPFTLKEAHASATIHVQLEKKGLPIGLIDILIAGTALANKAILVTHNTKEFRRIKKLKVEDWY